MGADVCDCTCVSHLILNVGAFVNCRLVGYVLRSYETSLLAFRYDDKVFLESSFGPNSSIFCCHVELKKLAVRRGHERSFLVQCIRG